MDKSKSSIIMREKLVINNYSHNINEMVIENYLDNIDKINKDDINILNNIEDENVVKKEEIVMENIIQEDKENLHYNEDIFFNCFDEDILINNAIACDSVSSSDSLDNNKNVISYVFDNEDVRHNDIFPFEDEIYNVDKIKSNMGILDRLTFIFSTTIKD